MKREIPSLDGLRAIAIAFVVLAHLTGTKGVPQGLAVAGAWGEFGVRVFFLISGYLITSLLLREHKESARINLPRFYLRRFMRLSPALIVYVGAIVLLSAMGRIQLRPGDATHALTYTMNFHFDRAWYLGHLWSLSVEEQFYLLWPAALCLAGPRNGLKVCVAVVVAGPLLRISLLGLPQFIRYSDELFFTVADALAMGCALAFLQPKLWKLSWYSRFQSSTAFYLLPITGMAFYAIPYWRVQAIAAFTLTNLCIALTIDQAIRMPRTMWGRFLNLAPLKVVGVMSYSLYLWQQPFLNRASHATISNFPLNLSLACCAAGLSYTLVESPALRLRQYLEKQWVVRTTKAIVSIT